MPSLRLLTSRRTTIALVLAAPLTLAACELDPPTDSSPAAVPPEPVPDAELLASARGAIMTMVGSVDTAIAAHPRLRPGLAPWLTLHAAHLAVLEDGSQGGSQDDSVETPPPAGTAASAIEALRSQEAGLARDLAEAARQAASGDLARALASMSAALRQRLVA